MYPIADKLPNEVKKRLLIKRDQWMNFMRCEIGKLPLVFQKI